MKFLKCGLFIASAFCFVFSLFLLSLGLWKIRQVPDIRIPELTELSVENCMDLVVEPVGENQLLRLLAVQNSARGMQRNAQPSHWQRLFFSSARSFDQYMHAAALYEFNLGVELQKPLHKIDWSRLKVLESRIPEYSSRDAWESDHNTSLGKLLD